MRSDPTNLRGAALEYASSSREKAFGPSQKAEIDALNALAYGLVYVGDTLELIRRELWNGNNA